MSSCQSCMMPLAKDPGKSGSNIYCSYCFKNGELCYKGTDLKEFQKISYQGMIQNGMNPWLARVFTFFIRFAPRWRK